MFLWTITLATGRVFAKLAAFLILLPTPAPGQQAEAAMGTESETFEILVEADEAAARSPFKAEDLEILVGGEPAEVLAVEPLAPAAGRDPSLRRLALEIRRPFRLLVYLDPSFATRPALYWTARDLAARSGDLTALGTVEIVEVPAAEEAPTPRVRLAATRDPQVVGAALEKVSNDLLNAPREAFGRQRQIRRAYLVRRSEALSRLENGGEEVVDDVARDLLLMAREAARLAVTIGFRSEQITEAPGESSTP